MSSKIEAAVRSVLPKLEEHLLAYLSSMVEENKDESVEEFIDTLSHVVMGYGAAETEEEADGLCRRLYEQVRGVEEDGQEVVEDKAAGKSSRNGGGKDKSSDKDKDKKKKKKKKKKSKSKSKHKTDKKKEAAVGNGTQWPTVGDLIEALYYEDGEWYDAEVVRVSPGDRYVVRFVAYGNQEVVTREMVRQVGGVVADQQDVEEEDVQGEDVAPLELLDAPVKIGSLETEAELARKAEMRKKWAEMKNRGSAAERATQRAREKLQKRSEAMEKRRVRLEAGVRERRKREKEERKARALDVYLSSMHARSRDVDLTDLSIGTVDGSLELLRHADIKLVSGRRYGLVGRNGVGKTTLLQAIAHYEVDGFPAHLRVALVEQEVVGDDRSVLQTVLHSDWELQQLLAEEKKLTNGAEEATAERMEQVSKGLEEIEAYSAEARAASILAGLGFDDEMQAQPTSSLSGGWRMRVALASGLFQRPDILLLDEPTNHVDFLALLWLENYLKTYPRTLILVSHDRAFVNEVVTDVIHFHSKRLDFYRGNYDTFEKVRTEKMKQQQRDFDAQQRRRAHIQSFIDRFRYNAKRASLAQSRIKALERMTLIEEAVDDPTFKFSFPEVEHVRGQLITTNHVDFSYTPEKRLLRDITISFDRCSRVGIVGRNGAGKSTLMKLLSGKLKPSAGDISTNDNARIAEFTQHHVDQLDLNLSSQELMQQRYPDAHAALIRRHLGSFGLSDDLALRPIRYLSGGQKSRVAFAVISWLRPNFLLLDECSNNLDSETIDALIIAINAFGGGIMLISHDRYLLDSVCEEFWAMKRGKLRRFRTLDEASKYSFSL